VPNKRIPLGESNEQVLKHLHRLWGFDVSLEQLDANGKIVKLAQCPAPNEEGKMTTL
jgi:spore cortex formation protein SpoVR/YcgB (stage V sporulation)